MKTRFVLLTLLSLIPAASPALAADRAMSKQLMMLMRADEFVTGMMRQGVRALKTEAGLTDAQVACSFGVPHSEFSDVVTTAISEGLSDEELAAALTFFRSPAGAHYVQALAAVARGERPPDSQTEEDSARIQAFSNTSAGDKLLKQRIFGTATVVTEKMAQVRVETLENCGKR